MKRITLLNSLLVIILTMTAMATEDIMIADFNGEDYGDWKVEGEAFGDGPIDDHMVGALRDGMAVSDRNSAVGTLTSPPFTIDRNAIHFLVGGQEVHFDPIAGGSLDKKAIQLLVDDKVVRETIPTKFHAIFWESWDVAEYKGKEARIRIIDEDKNGSAHIVVDHIVASDIPSGGRLLERTIKVAKPILNFPVKEGEVRHYIELVVDGKQVRAMDVGLTMDDPDYWVVTDLSPWMGKEILIRTRHRPMGNSKILDKLSAENGILDSEDLYRESLRPQFHFSSKRGWLNDPNGLVYYDGEWHLFYQHNPYNWDHSRNDYNKTWGHAVSTDLVHWEELPGVIHPDHLGTIYSGSAVVDHNNTTGFQTGKEKPIVAVYTSAGGRSPWSEGKPFSQSIAYSNDRGRTFTIYEGNPVLPNIEYVNRDPKAIWHEPTNQWVIVVHFDGRAMAFFTSKDLKKWEFQNESEFESKAMHDCPELFQLAVDGDKSNKKWVIYGGSAAYYLGEFDGKGFKPETGPTRFNYGNCFYASQTFSNVPEKDGRRVQIAWGTVSMEGMPFNQQMLFPVELTLRTTDEGLRIFAYPVEEIENLYGKEHVWNDVKLKPEQNILSDIEGELFDIDAEFKVGKADKFGFVINGKTVAYDAKKNQLSADGSRAKLIPVDGKISLRILVDRVSIEIYANDGRIYMPIRSLHEPNKKGLEIFTKGGKTKINSLIVHELKSIWK